MPKKKTASDPLVSSGATPARARKHAPAQRTAAAVEPSPSNDPTALTATQADTAPSNSGVTSEDIARLAYSYWEARGCQGGSSEEDWLRAEQELNAKLAASAASV